jgi:lysozyme
MHPLKVSDKCVELVKKFEGLHKKHTSGKIEAYICPAGVLTQGYGRTKGIRKDYFATIAECEKWLLEDLNEAGEYVRKLINVPLNQVQYDALVSFTFNLGPTNLKSSTLRKVLNKGDYEGVPAQIMRWNKARVNGKLTPLKGLTRRRTEEATLFAHVDEPLIETEIPEMPQKVVSKQKSLAKSKTMAGAGVAGVATALGEIAPKIEGLVQYSESMKFIFLGCAAGGILLAAYAKLKDNKG